MSIVQAAAALKKCDASIWRPEEMDAQRVTRVVWFSTGA
jgi:hypothetical protein